MKPDIRKSIIRAMESAKMSKNALAVAVQDHISRSLVYDYITGKHDIGSDKANHLLAALGLRIVEG